MASYLAVVVVSLAVGALVGVVVARRRDRTRSPLAGSERSAPRRVAALVADGVPPEQLFETITAEAGELLGADLAGMVRYESRTEAAPLAVWAATGEHPPLPERWTIHPGDPLDRVASTRGPVWVQDWSVEPGPVSESVRQLGARSSVGAPIQFDGRVWGAIAVHANRGRLPLDTEARLSNYAQLLATAMAHARARAEVQRLADEQAALRRVATLVAEESSPDEVFSVIVEELAGLLDADDTRMGRFEGEHGAVVVAGHGVFQDEMPVGTHLTPEDGTVTAAVRRTGRAARVEDYSGAGGALGTSLRQGGAWSAVGTPIVVDGSLWGVMIVGMRSADGLADDVEARVQGFCELAATAIANSETRREVQRLADEQAALRRVATLVAEGAAPTVVFDTVTAEAAAVLRAEHVALSRFESGPDITVLAHRGHHAAVAPIGTRVALAGDCVHSRILATGRPARMDAGDDHGGVVGQMIRELGINTTVGTPVVVDGRLWGAITVSWLGERTAPAEAELRLNVFAKLLEVAIANADSRAQLTASRSRMLEAGDEARRRVVRDLHDGAQQRLVHTIVTLKLARRALDQGGDGVKARGLMDEALVQAGRSNEELRELALGILPSVLTRGGLPAGVRALVAGVDLDVTVDLVAERYSPAIEASAYFVVAEALTNVMKHAGATRATVTAHTGDGMLVVAIGDDGIGGADPAGTGLLGIGDRVSALGGRLQIESPAGAGTLVRAAIPIG